MRFYHYTTVERATQMTNIADDRESGFQPVKALISREFRFDPAFPAKAREAASFGLLEPMPKGWLKKTFLDNEPVLETIIRELRMQTAMGVCLLEIEAKPQDDIYVADYMTQIGHSKAWQAGQLETMKRKIALDYCNSLIPLNEYKAGDKKYLVPEVVCFSAIPKDRVRVAQIFSPLTLINEIRQRGGFPLAVPRGFAALPALSPSVPSAPEKSAVKRGHLTLVVS